MSRQTEQSSDAHWWTVVLSDTDNDLESVRYSLQVAGICTKKGEWRNGVTCIRIIHTGDWLNKWMPEPKVTDFFQNLKETAPPSCEVVLLTGNHELEIIKRHDAGLWSPLSAEQVEFIRQQDFMHVAGHTLYVHGYPTFSLLRLLKQVHGEKKSLNSFNAKFRKAFFEGRYALYRDTTGLELLGDIREAEKYYIKRCPDGETRGKKISNLLRGLDIQTVVHGHRPHFWTQIDYELAIEVPGIRIIDNDNKAKKSGLGAALIDDRGNVLFVNPKQMYWAGGEKIYRKKLRKAMGTRKKDLQEAGSQDRKEPSRGD